MQEKLFVIGEGSYHRPYRPVIGTHISELGNYIANNYEPAIWQYSGVKFVIVMHEAQLIENSLILSTAQAQDVVNTITQYLKGQN